MTFYEPLGERTNVEIATVTRAGASGSPVFNEHGELVSMIMGGAAGAIPSGLCLDPPRLHELLDAAADAQPRDIRSHVNSVLKTIGNSGDIVTDHNGTLTCSARKAITHGRQIHWESHGDRLGNIGYWTSQDDWLSWNIDVSEGGEYTVVVISACPADTAGAKVAIEVLNGRDRKSEGNLIDFTVPDSGDFLNFREKMAGRIRLSVGKQTLTMQPLSAFPHAVMNLRSVVLRRVESDQKQ